MSSKHPQKTESELISERVENSKREIERFKAEYEKLVQRGLPSSKNSLHTSSSKSLSGNSTERGDNVVSDNSTKRGSSNLESVNCNKSESSPKNSSQSKPNSEVINILSDTISELVRTEGTSEIKVISKATSTKSFSKKSHNVSDKVSEVSRATSSKLSTKNTKSDNINNKTVSASEIKSSLNEPKKHILSETTGKTVKVLQNVIINKPPIKITPADKDDTVSHNTGGVNKNVKLKVSSSRSSLFKSSRSPTKAAQENICSSRHQKNYNVEETREFMQKQKEKRMEQIRLQLKESVNTVEERKRKLKELHQKSLQIITKNRERSRSRSRETPRDPEIIPPLQSVDVYKHPKQIAPKQTHQNRVTVRTKITETQPPLELTYRIQNNKIKESAATVIQSYFRGFKQRKIYKELCQTKKEKMQLPSERKTKITPQIIEKSLPNWLQAKQSYPYNFISAVKHKLSMVVNTPPKTLDAAVQSTPQNSFISSKELKEKIESSIKKTPSKFNSSMELKDKIKISDNSQPDIEEFIEKSIRSIRDYDPGSGKLNLDLKAVESLKLKPRNVDNSESDTSKNVPDLSSENTSHTKRSSRKNYKNQSSSSTSQPNLKSVSKAYSTSFESNQSKLTFPSSKLVSSQYNTSFETNSSVESTSIESHRTYSKQFESQSLNFMNRIQQESESQSLKSINRIQQESESQSINEIRQESEVFKKPQGVAKKSKKTDAVREPMSNKENSIPIDSSKSLNEIVSDSDGELNFEINTDRLKNMKLLRKKERHDGFDNTIEAFNAYSNEKKSSSSITSYNEPNNGNNSSDQNSVKLLKDQNSGTSSRSGNRIKTHSSGEIEKVPKLTRAHSSREDSTHLNAENLRRNSIISFNRANYSPDFSNFSSKSESDSVKEDLASFRAYLRENNIGNKNSKGKSSAEVKASARDSVPSFKTMKSVTSQRTSTLLQDSDGTTIDERLSSEILDMVPLVAPVVALESNYESDKENLDKNRNITLKVGQKDIINTVTTTNQIHVKFEAELHLLNDFNESLRQFMAVEKSLLDLRNKSNVQQETRDTQTSLMAKSASEPIAKSTTIASLNYSRGSDFHPEQSSLALNSFPTDSFVNNEDLIESNSKLIDDNSLFRNTALEVSELNDTTVNDSRNETLEISQVVISKDNNKIYAGLSLGMFEQLIKDEDARIENLKTILKIREKALLDRTKGELAWLEIQKKHLLETGKLHEASLVKKKQRGIIIKLQHEKHEMQKLKQIQKAASKERKTILKEQRNMIKAQLSMNSTVTKIKRTTSKERRTSGPVKVYNYHRETVKSETSVSKRSTVGEDIVYTSHSESVREITDASSSHPTEDTEKSLLVNSRTEIAKRSLLMREAALQKRRRAAEDLLQWHQKLLEEEKKITELEMAASNIINQVPTITVDNSSTNNRYKFIGSQLNVLWANMTGRTEKKFNDNETYNLSQIALERFCKDAKKYSNKKSGDEAKIVVKNAKPEVTEIQPSLDLKKDIQQSGSTLNEIKQNISNITDEISELYKLSSVKSDNEIPESQSAITASISERVKKSSHKNVPESSIESVSVKTAQSDRLVSSEVNYSSFNELEENSLSIAKHKNDNSKRKSSSSISSTEEEITSRIIVSSLIGGEGSGTVSLEDVLISRSVDVAPPEENKKINDEETVNSMYSDYFDNHSIVSEVLADDLYGDNQELMSGIFAEKETKSQELKSHVSDISDVIKSLENDATNSAVLEDPSSSKAQTASIEKTSRGILEDCDSISLPGEESEASRTSIHSENETKSKASATNSLAEEISGDIKKLSPSIYISELKEAISAENVADPVSEEIVADIISEEKIADTVSDENVRPTVSEENVRPTVSEENVKSIQEQTSVQISSIEENEAELSPEQAMQISETNTNILSSSLQELATSVIPEKNTDISHGQASYLPEEISDINSTQELTNKHSSTDKELPTVPEMSIMNSNKSLSIQELASNAELLNEEAPAAIDSELPAKISWCSKSLEKEVSLGKDAKNSHNTSVKQSVVVTRNSEEIPTSDEDSSKITDFLGDIESLQELDMVPSENFEDKDIENEKEEAIEEINEESQNIPIQSISIHAIKESNSDINQDSEEYKEAFDEEIESAVKSATTDEDHSNKKSTDFIPRETDLELYDKIWSENEDIPYVNQEIEQSVDEENIPSSSNESKIKTSRTIEDQTMSKEGDVSEKSDFIIKVNEENNYDKKSSSSKSIEETASSQFKPSKSSKEESTEQDKENLQSESIKSCKENLKRDLECLPSSTSKSIDKESAKEEVERISSWRSISLEKEEEEETFDFDVETSKSIKDGSAIQEDSMKIDAISSSKSFEEESKKQEGSVKIDVISSSKSLEDESKKWEDSSKIDAKSSSKLLEEESLKQEASMKIDAKSEEESMKIDATSGSKYLLQDDESNSIKIASEDSTVTDEASKDQDSEVASKIESESKSGKVSESSESPTSSSDELPIIEVTIEEKKSRIPEDPVQLSVDETIEDKDRLKKSSAGLSKSPVNVKQRVSEILADAHINSSIGDKSPRLQDLYVTAYDVITPDGSPELGSPEEDKSFLPPKDIYGNEAEELLRKQLAIEQEIKQLEQQQLPYLYMREIPNKPPPPYTPPVQNTPVVPATVLPMTIEQIVDMTPDISGMLYKAYTSNTLQEASLPEMVTFPGVDRECGEFVFDLCKEIASEHYSQFKEVSSVSWMKCNNRRLGFKRQLNRDDLRRLLDKRLKQIFGFEKVELKESMIIKWSRKKRDHVDELLVIESQAEETEWTSYDQDELIVKNDVTRDILNMLLSETAEVLEKILAKRPTLRDVC